MKAKVILRVKQTENLTFLNKFGNIIFEDDIIDIVIIEMDKSNIPLLQEHPEVIDIREERTGTTLENIA